MVGLRKSIFQQNSAQLRVSELSDEYFWDSRTSLACPIPSLTTIQPVSDRLWEQVWQPQNLAGIETRDAELQLVFLNTYPYRFMYSLMRRGSIPTNVLDFLKRQQISSNVLFFACWTKDDIPISVQTLLQTTEWLYTFQ